MELEQAIKYAIDGDAILFLGAGFSYGGINMNNEPMKVGKDLSYAICHDLGIAESDNLTISATRYLQDSRCKKSLKEFIDFLSKELICKEVTKEQQIVINLPWVRIYTTNYDNVVEMASKKSGLSRESITITNRRYVQQRNLSQAIVHINGYINSVDENNFYDEFKITDDTYNRDGLVQSSWRNMFEQDLQRSKSIIFIGYSLQYDQELVKFIANQKIKEKCVFIDIPSLNEDSEFKISLYGNLQKIGLVGLSEEINRILPNYTPNCAKTNIIGFEKIEKEDFYSDAKFTSIDAINLLVKGQIKRCYINQTGYCVQRQETIAEVKKTLLDKKVVIVQSKLGNGKSIFLECLANELIDDYNVYFMKSLDNYVEDIQQIQSQSRGETIIIVDDYGHYIELIKSLGKDFPENIKLVISCRTTININLYYDLIEKYGYHENDLYLQDIDTMTENDVYDLVKVLNENRLWGEYDTLTTTQKKKMIRKNYRLNFSQVFYILLNSKAIENEIGKVVKVLDEKQTLKEFVILQVINSLCNLKFGYADLCRFAQISDNLLRTYAMDQNVREILDVTNNCFILSSSIYAQYLVRKSDMKQHMRETLQRLYIECSQNDAWLNRYKQQRRLLVSRSNVKLAFSPKSQLSKVEEKEVFKYFDSIKQLPTATDNPFFWLQFAITVLNLEKYELAKIYFENAYANADKMDDFDSYQIDTHFARFLLCDGMRTNQNNKTEALDNFNKAHRLLVENSNTGTKISYVLRQASLYEEYFNVYKNILNEDEKNDFLSTASEMIRKFSDYFKLKELFKIPYDVAASYIKFRKIFQGTPYQLLLTKVDTEYNNKVTDAKWKVR